MCGRFTLILEPEAIQKDLNLGEFPPDFPSRYNVAPTQPVAVVTDPGSRNVELFRWGLIPTWAKDPSIGSRLINARSETLAEKPSFRTAFSRRRCLILADGFYEWHRPGGQAGYGENEEAGESRRAKGPSTPYYFHLASGKPFAFAGLWDTWRPAEGSPEAAQFGGLVRSCTIITTSANALLGQYHNRMPVILDGDALWEWLDPQTKIPALQNLLIPYPAERMDAHPVSPRVNSPANDSPELIQPASTVQ